MTEQQVNISRPTQNAPPIPIAAVVQRLTSFAGSSSAFLYELLAAQCALTGVAESAAITKKPDGQPQILASHPPLQTASSDTPPPAWLAHAIEVFQQHADTQQTLVRRLAISEPTPGQPSAHHLVLVPVRIDDQHTATAQVFLLATDDAAVVNQLGPRIELVVSLWSLYALRGSLDRSDASLHQLTEANRVLAAGNAQLRFAAASLAVCNEVASRWDAERVSLGLLSGRFVKLRAMSHTEHVSRKMQLVQDIESAMEESLDQDTEVVIPGDPQQPVVSRATRQLADTHGSGVVCSLPLRVEGETVGALTVERASDQPFTADEVGYLRMACELITPRLYELSQTDRWFGARLAASSRKSVASLLGPTHTWAKLTAVAILFGLIALILVPGTYRVEAPFEFQAVTRRAIPAPFDGYLIEVLREPDDKVQAGDVLARLDTAELRIELARLQAERLRYETEAKLAGRENDQAQVQIAKARAEDVAAQTRWLQWQIDHADLRSPLDATVLTGDLKRSLGSPVRKGDVLFEVAPLDALRAELWVGDGHVTDIQVGDTGTLAAAAHPGERLTFTVEHIHPIAEAIDGRNAFRVRVKLQDQSPWVRPGLEGVAKIDTDRAPLGWVWTRDAVNWVRMKLWL